MIGMFVQEQLDSLEDFLPTSEMRRWIAEGVVKVDFVQILPAKDLPKQRVVQHDGIVAKITGVQDVSEKSLEDKHDSTMYVVGVDKADANIDTVSAQGELVHDVDLQRHQAPANRPGQEMASDLGGACITLLVGTK